MRRLQRIALLVLVCGGIIVEGAAAKGLDMAATEGVAVRGSEYRYLAISFGVPGALTYVARVERDGGRLSRYWYLRGRFHVPAVAYDGSAGGLSADGRTLVLVRSLSYRSYPPRITRLAILDTQRSTRWRGKWPPPRFRRFADFVDLRGHFSFDAISPDGSTVYLIHHYLPLSTGGSYITNYRVRALDLDSGRLLPKPIVDPEEPGERMQGTPVSRASSPDGRWAYTLYDGYGQEPFIHALDTVGRRAVCIDLPQLEDARNLFMLGLRTERHGRQLAVLRRRSALEEPSKPSSSPPLLTVSTTSFEVREPRPAQVDRSGDGPPWLPIGVVVGTTAIALAWVTRRKRKAIARGAPERA